MWLIDHGASLYFHHNWSNWKEQAMKPFVLVKDHVLLPQATDLERVDEEFGLLLTNERIRSIVDLIRDEWLVADTEFETIQQHRDVYIQFLESRFANSAIFLKEAQHAATTVI